MCLGVAAGDVRGAGRRQCTLRLTWLRASHSSRSLCRSKGSRLLRTVPLKSTGSCDTRDQCVTLLDMRGVLVSPISSCRLADVFHGPMPLKRPPPREPSPGGS